jgi:hypothetical protein
MNKTFVALIFLLTLPLLTGGQENAALSQAGADPSPVAHVKTAPASGSARTMAFTADDAAAVAEWQENLREALIDLLGVRKALQAQPAPFNAQELSRQDRGSYWLRTIEIDATPARRMSVLLGISKSLPAQKAPAVVCIHGHGGTAQSVYDGESIYKGFAAALSSQGYITIAADVGQHEIFESGNTLMGERLNDLVRCVDYLVSLSWVDNTRIGCAGLSLGGEMAMWLGAVDTRVAATVSAGFLTMMDQLEQNHCMCWKFEGLRELADFPDIYGLIAPRALQCQIGRNEPPTQFNADLAGFAFSQVQAAYTAAGQPARAVLHLHEGGHEIDLQALLAFLNAHIGDSRM